MNDITYIEAARALAERVLVGGGACDDRIERLFQFVLARKPTAEEKSVLRAGAERLVEEFGSDPEAASQLLGTGEIARNPRLDPVEHAAYTCIATAVLNLDEALTKE
jgi:hypothetical protein